MKPDKKKWKEELTLFILNFSLHILDRVSRFDFQSDGFASKSLYEYLHTTSETEYQVESRLFLNVVVRQSTAVFQLLPGKN